ncbi:MAG: hypothetical protein RPU60_12935 [Candidatus Sedimenticola sp. (ex Thyasira tokunagai)]
MFEIDSPGHVANRFTEGDPLVPLPATQVSAEWLNAVQDELVSVIEGAGIVLDKEDPAQLLAAIGLLIGGSLPSLADYLKRNATANLTVGYTTDVLTINGSSYTVDFKTKSIATWSITGNIALSEPATAGEYGTKFIKVAVDGSDRTLNLGSGVVLGSGSLTLKANKKHELFIRRYDDDYTLVDVLEIP